MKMPGLYGQKTLELELYKPLDQWVLRSLEAHLNQDALREWPYFIREDPLPPPKPDDFYEVTHYGGVSYREGAVDCDDTSVRVELGIHRPRPLNEREVGKGLSLLMRAIPSELGNWLTRPKLIPKPSFHSALVEPRVMGAANDPMEWAAQRLRIVNGLMLAGQKEAGNAWSSGAWHPNALLHAYTEMAKLHMNTRDPETLNPRTYPLDEKRRELLQIAQEQGWQKNAEIMAFVMQNADSLTGEELRDPAVVESLNLMPSYVKNGLVVDRLSELFAWAHQRRGPGALLWSLQIIQKLYQHKREDAWWFKENVDFTKIFESNADLEEVSKLCQLAGAKFVYAYPAYAQAGRALSGTEGLDENEAMDITCRLTKKLGIGNVPRVVRALTYLKKILDETIEENRVSMLRRFIYYVDQTTPSEPVYAWLQPEEEAGVPIPNFTKTGGTGSQKKPWHSEEARRIELHQQLCLVMKDMPAQDLSRVKEERPAELFRLLFELNGYSADPREGNRGQNYVDYVAPHLPDPLNPSPTVLRILKDLSRYTWSEFERGTHKMSVCVPSNWRDRVYGYLPWNDNEKEEALQKYRGQHLETLTDALELMKWGVFDENDLGEMFDWFWAPIVTVPIEETKNYDFKAKQVKKKYHNCMMTEEHVGQMVRSEIHTEIRELRAHILKEILLWAKELFALMRLGFFTKEELRARVLKRLKRVKPQVAYKGEDLRVNNFLPDPGPTLSAAEMRKLSELHAKGYIDTQAIQAELRPRDRDPKEFVRAILIWAQELEAIAAAGILRTDDIRNHFTIEKVKESAARTKDNKLTDMLRFLQGFNTTAVQEYAGQAHVDPYELIEQLYTLAKLIEEGGFDPNALNEGASDLPAVLVSSQEWSKKLLTLSEQDEMPEPSDQAQRLPPDLKDRFVRRDFQAWLQPMECPDLAVANNAAYRIALDNDQERTSEEAALVLNTRSRLRRRVQEQFDDVTACREATFGFYPPGAKMHLNGISPALSNRMKDMGLSSSFFRLDGSSCIILPAVPSYGELVTLVRKVAVDLGLNEFDPQLQVCMAGHFQDKIFDAIMGAMLLLTTPIDANYGASAFTPEDLNHAVETGSRLIINEARGAPGKLMAMPFLPPDLLESRQRTDYLGRKAGSDVWRIQLVHTVLQHMQRREGPFKDFGPEFITKFTDFLRSKKVGLGGVLNDEWRLRPGEEDTQEKQKTAMESIAACTAARSDVNNVLEARDIVDALAQKVARVQTEMLVDPAYCKEREILLGSNT